MFMRKFLPLVLCCLLLTGCAQSQSTPPENGVSRMPLRAILNQLLEKSDLHLGSLFSAGEPSRDEVAYAIGTDEFTQPYAEALLYGPSMGISAFELLLFRLDAGVSAEDFTAALRQCADCHHWTYLQADFVDTAVNGQIVLFLMADDTICPARTRESIQTTFAALDPLDYDPSDYVSAARPVVLVGDATMAELLEKVAGDCSWLGQPPYAALPEVSALAALDDTTVSDSAISVGARGLCGLLRARDDASLPGLAAALDTILSDTALPSTSLIVYGNQLVGFCRADTPDAFAVTNSMIRRFGLTDYEKNFTKTP
jgi:hypothetical protein